MKLKTLQLMTFVSFSITATMTFARDYIIFSIAQEIPMGEENEKPQKNYYVNMGTQQGLEQGSVLNVYRIISRLDPYQQKTRHNFKFKIGELEILHTEEDSSIANLKEFSGQQSMMMEIEAFMVGDEVNVKTD